MVSHQPQGILVAAIVLLCLLVPTASAAEPAFVRGSIFPVGVVFADGRLFVPPSQPYVAAWSSEGDQQQKILFSEKLQVFVDEWQWTSPTPAPRDGGATPPPTGLHTHAEFQQANSTLRLLRAGAENRWYLSALDGGSAFFAGSASDCDFYGATPTALAMRVASSVLTTGSNAIRRVAIQEPTTLHLDCAIADLNLTLPQIADHELAAFDVELHLAGQDPITLAPSTIRLAAGSFSAKNESFPALYDNLVRHVSLRPSAGTRIHQDARRVTLESPVLQVEGTILLPPFEGDLLVGNERLFGAASTTRLAGNFLVVPGGHRGAEVGVEIAGSSSTSQTLASSTSAFPVKAAALASLVSLSAALVVLLWAKGKQLLAFALALFTRLTPVRALEHDLRKAIHDYVQANPGVRLHAAYKALGLNRSTFTHHAQSLHQQGLLVIQRDGRKINLFPTNLPSEETRRILAAARDPFEQQLLSTLEEPVPLTQAEIARRLKVSQAYVSKKIASLERRGIVLRRKGLGGTRYEVRNSLIG
jgi:predicted transcriptional regulator